MNPKTNRFEPLKEATKDDLEKLKRELADYNAGLAGRPTPLPNSPSVLLRPDGTPVPEHWSKYKVDEHVEVKGYTFRVAYIGESVLLLEPIGPVLLGEGL